MAFATLKCDGIAPLQGTVETDDDYIRFCTNARLSNQQLNELHRALIQIGGRSETVLVESADMQVQLPTSKASRSAFT